MNLTEAKRLKKGTRLIWEDDETGLGPYMGTVLEKRSGTIIVQWDGEEDPETSTIDRDESYYFNCLTRVSK